MNYGEVMRQNKIGYLASIKEVANMKVLGLSAGRSMGNTEILIKEAFTGAKEFGAEVELIRVFDLIIKPCTGCLKCLDDRMKGGKGECVIKNDHMPFLLEKMLECDGMIVGAPAYEATPPGRLKVIYDRFLGSGQKFIQGVLQNPKVTAVICVGGTDAVNLVLPLTKQCFPPEVVTKLVDQMLVTFTCYHGDVLLNDDAIARARRLGRNIGKAMSMPFNEVKYVGEEEETCPVCHSNLLTVRGKFVECPICDIKGSIELKGDKLTVTYTEEQLQRKIRSTPEFEDWHAERILQLRQKYEEHKLEIKEKMKKYKAYKPTPPPPLKAK
jgi:multimeric flavodoxin WrbA